MGARNSHCSYCGNAFEKDQIWPRLCGGCGEMSFQNPAPVAVLLQPIDAGLLTVRRGVEPRKGELALPGGYVDIEETWQAAAAREMFEECQIDVDPGAIRTFDAVSAPDGTVLLFGLAPALKSSELPVFEPSPEATERVIIDSPELLAFPRHKAVATLFFRNSGRT